MSQIFPGNLVQMVDTHSGDEPSRAQVRYEQHGRRSVQTVVRSRWSLEGRLVAACHIRLAGLRRAIVNGAKWGELNPPHADGRHRSEDRKPINYDPELD